jgi:3-hydroxyacyl-[acyl-carrier-protein] dehydratase
MPPELIMDPLQVAVDPLQVEADRAKLRQVNPQRFDMEQLDAVVSVDRDQHVIIGYKDVRTDEFWVRGHMPGYPILPGVLMCEAAAQLISYYMVTAGFKEGDYVGFGGMEDVRFRLPVRPGDRLLLIGKARRLHRRQSTFQVQGFVGKNLVFHADIIGIQLRRSEAGQENG